jgi:hypothetical protein
LTTRMWRVDISSIEGPTMAPSDEVNCTGMNYSIKLDADQMTLENTRWSKHESHQFPLGDISAIIVERKTVMPFATLTVLAVIATFITKMNLLWFLVELSLFYRTELSTIALLFVILFAIPTLARSLFVNVSVSCDGRSNSFLVRFVPVRQGRRLASQFQNFRELT